MDGEHKKDRYDYIEATRGSFTLKGIYRLEVKGWKEIININEKQQ